MIEPNPFLVRTSVIEALYQAGHLAAAEMIERGSWLLEDAEIRIEVSGIGKKMLSLTFNGAARKIAEEVLQNLGIYQNLRVISGGF